MATLKSDANHSRVMHVINSSNTVVGGKWKALLNPLSQQGNMVMASEAIPVGNWRPNSVFINKKMNGEG